MNAAADEFAKPRNPRLAGDIARELARRLRHGAALVGATALFANPLYRLSLAGRRPRRLAAMPADPWPGDPKRGAAILAGDFDWSRGFAPDWAPRREADAVRAWLHGFSWLRDLRATGDEAARHRAREMVGVWIGNNANWRRLAWRGDVVGHRLGAWVMHGQYLTADADETYRRRFFAALCRQARHLGRCAGHAGDGVDRLAAVKGLILVGVCVPGGEAWLDRGLLLLERELPAQILADGGHVSRSPAGQLAALKILVEIRAASRASRRPPSPALQSAIDRAAPMLRFFRHVDGGLALFNGSVAGDADEIDIALARAEAKGAPPASAPQAGFERLAAKDTVLLVDIGAPRTAAARTHAHAGLLSIEMSTAKHRLIVNCGAHLGGDAGWRAAARSTAAHSTLELGGRNVFDPGSVAARIAFGEKRRAEADGAVLLDVSHDGYFRALGLVHRRRLYLSADGNDLRGEESFTGRGRRPFTLRFHLHPSARASLTRRGEGALLRPGGGAGWRFHASGGALRIVDSVYLGDGGKIQRTEQLVVTGDADKSRVIKWAFSRVGGGAPDSRRSSA